MKILFTRFPLESAMGGAEIQTLSLMEELLHRGHAVAFLGSCPVLLEECKKRGIPFAELQIGPPPVTKWSVVSFLWRRSSMRYQLEQAFNQFHDLDAVCMLSLSEKVLLTPEAMKRKLKILWIEHDTIGRWLTKNPVLPELIALARHVTTIVVSELGAGLYRRLGWPDDKTVGIPNGIEAHRLAGAHWHPGTSPFTVGTIARLTPDKGVDVLVEACTDKHLKVVGRGRGDKHIRSLLGPNHTLTNWVDHLGEFYAGLSCFVLPSRDYDPFGLVAAEAMLTGTPTIVTDACGIADSLTHEHDALIVPPGDPEALNNAITQIESDPELAQKLSQNGKHTAETLFSINAMVDSYEHILQS